MKIVGKQLEAWAQSEIDSSVKNLFARSVFNRYYYATFLITYEMLCEFSPDWRGAPHKSMPSQVESNVKNLIVNHLKKEVKLIPDEEMTKLQADLESATSALADLLRNAKEIREIADYKPDVLVEIKGNVMSLNNYKLNTAGDWADKANGYCEIIRHVRRSAGFA